MKIIVNPCAGRRRWRMGDLDSLSGRRGPDIEWLVTECPGHAARLARSLVEAGARRLGVMGGDGTVSEVIGETVGRNVEVGLLPIGTGNDIARSLALPLDDPKGALEILLGGEARRIDVGWERERHFVSALGLGFPVEVVRQANRLGWVKGSAAYLLAVYRAARKMRPFDVRLEADGKRREVVCTSVLIQNTPFIGGGLRMAPPAKIDDGVFELVLVGTLGRLDLMWNFPRVYAGRHLTHPSFSIQSARSVRIETVRPQTKLFDGEIGGSSPLEARILPGAALLLVRSK